MMSSIVELSQFWTRVWIFLVTILILESIWGQNFDFTVNLGPKF